MQSPIRVWRFPRGAVSFSKKLTALLLAFLFFITPVARVFAQEAGGDASAAPSPATDSATITPPSDTGTPPPADTGSAVTPPAQPDNQAGQTTAPNPTGDSSAAVNPSPADNSQSSNNPDSSAVGPATPDTSSNPVNTGSDTNDANKTSTPDAATTKNISPMTSGNGNDQVFSQANVNQVDLPLLNKSSGGLQYSYPFQIPSGRNNFQPDLKLVYDSQDSNQANPFGYGWEINIPYIQRVNKAGTDSLYSNATTTTFFESSLSGELVLASSTGPPPKSPTPILYN